MSLTDKDKEFIKDIIRENNVDVKEFVKVAIQENNVDLKEFVKVAIQENNVDLKDWQEELYTRTKSEFYEMVEPFIKEAKDREIDRALVADKLRNHEDRIESLENTLQD